MNSFIFYLGTFNIVNGTIFLTVPIIYLELGKPKDLIKAFLNLLKEIFYASACNHLKLLVILLKE